MNSDYVLMEYYILYLEKVRKLSESSIKHYLDALRYISKFLVEREKIKMSIYEIHDINQLKLLRSYLYSEPNFVALNERGHHMYSAGLNNYFKFANGENFNKKKKELEVLDIEVEMGEVRNIERTTWKRSDIIKRQSIEFAGYICEINMKHNTFISESTNKQYMEGHHAIPLKEQRYFDKSIDIYANIICLCPNCHRLLHYGLKESKKILLNQIYDERSKRLAHSGIKVSKQEFIRLSL
ncbi:MAG: hypothetical protein E7247_04225 [Paenibacillaceae bacterium]|nr:hypothetical protein [Paenibacillaceae bacterium]